jgi:XPB/Ssl2-like helicase family protein
MTESDASDATGRDPGLAEAARFQRDLYLTWRAAAEGGGLPLTGRGYLTRAALRGLRAQLAAADGLSVPANGADVSETEDLRPHFLRRLLQRLGLLRLAPSVGADERDRPARASDGGRLIAAEREEMGRYLDHPLAERLRICARLWVAGGWWPDQPDGRGPPPRVMTPAPPRLAVARRRLLDALAAAIPGATYPLPPLRAETPAQRRSRVQGRAGAQRPPAAARVATQGGDAAIQAAALLGPLTWLGFVTPGPDQTGGGTAHTYQVCAPARALRQDEPTPDLREAHGRIVALPNLTLVAYAPLTAPALLLLDTCAERQALETTARYTLTRAAFARAGWGAEATAARLRALTGAALPQNVRVTLADWERRVERLRLTRDARVLTVDDAAVLDALLADRAASSWVRRRLTPTVALLAEDALPDVHRWLLRRGHLPATSG